MKAVKLTPSMYRDCIKLLKKCGLVNEKEKTCYPEKVYISAKDYKILKYYTYRAFRLEYPKVPLQKLKASIEMHLLNYSPNTSLREAIKPGYVLVET